MRRKFLSVVLCVCMMMTMAPFAFAAGETAITATTTDLSSGTYILEDDVTLTSGALTIPTGANVTIKLNGKKLTNKDGNHTIVNNGTLTITGSGTVDNISNSRAALYNNAGATATLNGGTYTRSHEAGQDKDTSGGNSYYTLKNFGSMTINSGVTVKQDGTTNGGTTGKYSSLVANGWYDASKNGSNGEPTPTAEAVLTINGGTFSGGLNTIKNDDYGTLTINDGLFKNYAQCAFFNANKATINGGTFVNDGTRGVVYTYAKWNETYGQGILNINGGVFVTSGTSIIEKNNNTATVNITGGVFSKEIPGSTAKGGLYVYPSTNPVAKIGDFKFSNLADAAYAAADGDTITLLANTTLYEKLQLNRKVVLDLGNYTITRASTGEQRAIWVNSGADVTINSGSNGCVTAPVIALQVNNGGKLTVNGGAYHGAYALASFSSADKTAETIINNGVFDGWIYTNGTGHKDYITFNGGTYNEMMYLASGDQSTYTITNGTFKKGLEIDAGRLGISGGTFTANEDTSGNVNDPITNNNGSGAYVGTIVVCKPSGSSTTGYIGDAVVNITGGTFENAFANSETIVVADYGQSQNHAGKAKVTISGDAKVTGKVVLYKATGNTGEQLDISGGYFTSDPTTYLATGYVAGSSNLTGYNYKVTQKTDTGTVEVKPAVAAPTVNVNADAIKADDTTAVENAAKSISVSTLGAAATDKAQNIDKDTAEKAVERMPAGTKLYVQSTLKVTPTAYDSIKKEFALEITPQYRIVASTAANADAIDSTSGNKVIQDYTDMSITQPTEVTMQLPVGFAQENDKLSIKHIKNGTAEYYTGIVTKDSESNLYLTFTTNGFSPFVISAAAAFIGDTAYPTFQEAVENVKNDETITLAQNVATDTVVTVARTVKFSIDTSSSSFVFNKDKNIVAGSNTTVNVTGTESSYTYNFTYTRPSSGGPGSSGGSISAPTTYAVNVNAATNGAVAADKKTASKGTTVTVTASPSKGYVVDAVKVVDKDGKDVAVTEKDGKYVFTMPASAVTVTGSFKAETPAPVALPFTDVKSGNWFYDAVKYAYAQGLMTGTSATTFAPNGTMNRAMIVTVLYRLEKSPAVTGASKFTDVPAGQWYSDAVAWAAANKIVNGYDETTFGPMNAVTREQMAAILFRYEQVKGLENVTLEENLNRFPDQNKISAYAIPALQWAVGQKIINGNADGTLDPTGTATRAQVAQIFTNLLNK